jgi:hypothetical protein
MWRGLKLTLLSLCCALAGFIGGVIFVRTPSSMVVSIVRERVDATTDPFMCILDEMGNVHRYLSREGIQTDKFDNLRTIDDENMLVVFDGREVTAVRFTTFGHRFGEEKCSRIDR